MSMERELFSSSGPFHLQNIDWSNPCHRKSVAACLVQGAYSLETDRCRGYPVGSPDEAIPWWDFFGFQLSQTLVDEDDGSYFGAIYQYKYEQYAYCTPPRFVIAFRGTSTRHDIRLDFQFIRHNLHRCVRFQRALQAAESIVASSGTGNVWLAGHSLGSAIALMVGRRMVSRHNAFLETYLFNPPFDAPPIERIQYEKIKDGIRIVGSFITAGVATIVNHGNEDPEERNGDSFSKVSEWIPYLFVNQSDPIGCEYIGYFSHREKMVQFGYEKVGQTATQMSVLSIVSDAIGKDYEAVHLIPSAYLTINVSPASDMRQAHTITQWWSPNIQCDYKLYRFK